jgi:hypothetical protein
MNFLRTHQKPTKSTTSTNTTTTTTTTTTTSSLLLVASICLFLSLTATNPSQILVNNSSNMNTSIRSSPVFVQAFVQHHLTSSSHHHRRLLYTATTTSRLNRNLPTTLTETRSQIPVAPVEVVPTSPTTSPSLLQFSRFTTKPTFIDDNPSSKSSYQIPPYIQGDDTLTSSKLRKNQRIISFGDVHGDILALYNFLQATQLLHANSTLTNPIWDGGDAILVQCGDILDRGPNELFCLRYLSSLARQAKDDGGKVLLIHGNHEILNSNGLFHYTDEKGDVEIENVFGEMLDKTKSGGSQRWRIQYAGNQPSRWNAFEPGGWLSEPLLCHMNVAVVVGKTVFVHGGLTKDHLVKYGGITKMNEDVRGWYTKPLPDYLQNDDGYKFQSVDDVISNANARAKYISKNQPACLGGGIGAASPVWMRDFSSPADGVPKQPQRAQTMINDCLDQVSQELGEEVQRMVMGHTPQEKINSALQDKAWRIDVGASKGVMNGKPEVLEIIHCGGENDEDVINILTPEGDRIPALERQTLEIPFF